MRQGQIGGLVARRIASTNVGGGERYFVTIVRPKLIRLVGGAGDSEAGAADD